MFNQQPSHKFLCDPVYVFGVIKVSYILTTSSYFDNLELDVFHAGDPQCRIITSINIAVRTETLSVY